MVEYRVLGNLEVAANGRLADLGPPKRRALLAILILHLNEVVPVDQLVDDLWGDRPPRQASHAIQVYVSELRQALGPLANAETIVWRAPGYMLAADPGAVDARRFELLVADGARLLESGDLKGAEAPLEQARELWRGRPLADVAYEEFAQRDIRRLSETWLHATELLARVELELARPDEALALAQAAAAEDPLRERACELAMLALYRCGRPAEAIRNYEAFRRLLAAELDVEPSPALRQLGERILVHDPSLGPGDVGSVDVPVEPHNPYKGLRAFAEADAADFFGRTTLVDELAAALAAGKRLVALVGPSGSGKSSVLQAGLVPALRSGRVEGSERWAIQWVRPDVRPVDELDAAMSMAFPDRDLVLIIDQFEQLFTAAPENDRAQFLERLTRAAADAPRLRIVLALRADFYDRPLTDAGFAPLFLAGVVHVLPMTAAELQAAVVEPARRVGVEVDPALLAELISDTSDHPGALPLVEHVLSALFEERTDSSLRLDGYRALGGLRGALTTRAESVFAALGEAGQGAAQQVFLRLVRLGEGQRHAHRRATIRELTSLGIDPVVLSGALRAFETERLLTFDRDPVSGDATVEVAHEALIAEWDRLAGWVDRYERDLRQHAWLAVRVDEWLSGGRMSDDLLAEGRLDECQAWRATTSFALTADERAFLDASVERRRAKEAGEQAREARERRLERRARLRLIGLVGTAIVLVVAVGYALVAWPGAAPDVVLVYPGSDLGGMYQNVATGFNQAMSRLELDTQTIIEASGDPEGLEQRLRRLADQGVDLIVVGFRWSNPEIERVARDHPETLFLAVDYWGKLPNVAVARFPAEEGSFLVGAAAALRSETGVVGIVVDGDDNLEWPYPAGFEAGARAVDPEVKVLTSYLVNPNLSDPNTPITVVMVGRAAREMYRAGADVVFYAGASAAPGLFEAASLESTSLGRQLWAVALDADWYVVLPLFATDAPTDVAAWRSHVLTSLVTRWDVGVSTMLDDYARGQLRAGPRRFGLADGGFELSQSGGAIDDFESELASLREQIVSGKVIVPRYPTDRGPPH